jgi:hypothetical protein
LPQHLSHDHHNNEDGIMGVHGIRSGFHQHQQRTGTGEEVEHHQQQQLQQLQLRQIEPQLTQQQPQQYVQQHPMGIWGEGSSHGGGDVTGKQSVSGHGLHHQHANIPQPQVPHVLVPRAMGVQNAGDYGIDSTGVAGQHRQKNPLEYVNKEPNPTDYDDILNEEYNKWIANLAKERAKENAKENDKENNKGKGPK